MMSIDSCRHGQSWTAPCSECVAENIAAEKVAQSEEEQRIGMLEARMPKASED